MAGKKEVTATVKLRYCPICGEIAGSPHHVKPRSLGGTDDYRNIVWLCKPCHDIVEEIQEREQLEFCPDLVKRQRSEQHITLAKNKEGGASESYVNHYGYMKLAFIIRPDGTKQVIEQYIGAQPPWLHPQRQEAEEVVTSQTIKDVIGVPSIVRRGKGRPAKDIDDKYLKELRYNEGLSYRQIARKLKNENDYEISRTAIHDHLVKSKHHHIPESAICEYVGCRKEYKPWLENQRYCSPECNARANQRGMPKKKDKKPARRSRKPRK